MDWSYDFDARGGSNYVYAAYVVYRGNQAVLVIDVQDFLSDEEKEIDSLCIAPNVQAEYYARAICHRMQGL